jgi:hypothetical protein
LTWALFDRIMRLASAKSSFQPRKCSTPRGRTARFPAERTQSENRNDFRQAPDEEHLRTRFYD